MKGTLGESNGQGSMRRVGAAIMILAMVELFNIAAWRDSKWGFWAGVASEAGAIILLFFTTWADLKEIALAILKFKKE